MNDKDKLKIIAKTFLTVNKGKWYNSKEICDFINNNNLCVRNGVVPTQLTRYMGEHYCRNQGIDRKRGPGRSVWYYSIGGLSESD